jgi:HopA1 effector protein family
MTCKLCSGADHTLGRGPHPILNCSTFVRVPQPVKDAIKKLWEDNPQAIARGESLSNWIYDHIYSPGAQQGGHWTSYFNSAYPGGLLDKVIEERIYLSVKGARLLHVWNALQPLFSDIGEHDVVQAKHCQVAVADARPDSIVIYLRNKAAVWRFCDGLRGLRQAGAIADTDFKNTTPPGTGCLPDLPGVATARQPDNHGDSFGGELCRILGKVFDARNRPMRMPVMLDFMVFCLAELKQNGIDITRPWNRPRQIF